MAPNELQMSPNELKMMPNVALAVFSKLLRSSFFCESCSHFGKQRTELLLIANNVATNKI